MNKWMGIVLILAGTLVGCRPGTPALSPVASPTPASSLTFTPLPRSTLSHIPQRTIQPPAEALPTLFTGQLTPGFKQTQIATGTAAAATRIANRETAARATLASDVMTATPPEVIESHLSPDGKSRAEVVRYDCVKTGEEEQIAYELLRLVKTKSGEEISIADQLQYCGGLGAAGLGFVYWSANSHYLYYTDSAQGMPDGWGLGWYRSLFRYDLLSGETFAMRWGPLAPDGITMVYADPRELSLYIWDLDKGEIARIPSSFTAGTYGPAIYGLTWSPNGKSLVYAETDNAYEPTNAKSWIFLLDLATFERQVLYQSDSGTLYCCQWQSPRQIQFNLDDQAPQFVDVPKMALGTEEPTSLWCERPDDLQETKVATTHLPESPRSFCIVWSSSTEKVMGYRVELKYEESGESIQYASGPFGTQWIVPFEYQPRLDESQEQFMRRHSYSVGVHALSTQGEDLVGSIAVEVDNPDFFLLPTATPSPLSKKETASPVPTQSTLSVTSVASLALTPSPSPTSTLMVSTDVFPLFPETSWTYTYIGYSQSPADPDLILRGTLKIRETVFDVESYPPFVLVHILGNRSLVEADPGWQVFESVRLGDYEYFYVLRDGNVYRTTVFPDPENIQTTGMIQEFQFPMVVGAEWCPSKLDKGYLTPPPETPIPCAYTGKRVVEAIGAYQAPAGRFEQCYQMRDMVNSGGVIQWFCEGVGLVAMKYDHSGSRFGFTEELTTFTLGSP